MATAPKPKKDYTPVPAGTHIARLVRIVYIGTVPEEYQGETKMMYKIRLGFELPNETKVFKEGTPAQPLMQDQEFTFSMGAKARLRPLIEGIVGNAMTDDEAYAFDIDSIIGKACLLTIKHKTSKAGNTRAEIASCAPLMKGQEAPTQVNPSRIFGFSNWNQEEFEKLPEFIKNKIKTSEEYSDKFGKLEGKEAEELIALKKARGFPSGELPVVKYPEEVDTNDIPF